jgi:hypothetical protein
MEQCSRQRGAVVFIHGRPGAELRKALRSAGYTLRCITGTTTIWSAAARAGGAASAGTGSGAAARRRPSCSPTELQGLQDSWHRGR